VTLRMRLNPEGFEVDPGRHVRYPIDLSSAQLQAGTAIDTLANVNEPAVGIANDYPRSDGIHLFSTPLSSPGTSMEFELFNPGGDLFDSTDLNTINRRLGPELFEKSAWMVFEGQGDSHAMVIELESVTIENVCSIFCGDMESP
jgi:hypothetical protein